MPRPPNPNPDPVKQRAGRRGADVRWHGHTPRIVRLDDLTGEQRRLVLALIDAARSANAGQTA